MNYVKDIVPYFLSQMSNLYEDYETKNMAYLSIQKTLGFNRSTCILNKDSIISRIDQNKLMSIITRLLKEEPIQYILEECMFYSLRFYVNEHVLIPRPETEELVQWVLKEKFETVLDLGTGSGCIAIALAKNTTSKVAALDVCRDALLVAEENARINNVEIDFFHRNILNQPDFKKHDIIVSNPPYVLEREQFCMKKNVLKYEPSKALFVSDKNPLLFYKSIIAFAKKNLNKNGRVFFEINENKGLDVVSLLRENQFEDIELKKDINDKDRMVKAIWKL